MMSTDLNIYRMNMRFVFTESWRLGKNNSISSHKNQEWRKYVKACILELKKKKKWEMKLINVLRLFAWHFKHRTKETR